MFSWYFSDFPSIEDQLHLVVAPNTIVCKDGASRDIICSRTKTKSTPQLWRIWAKAAFYADVDLYF